MNCVFVWRYVEVGTYLDHFLFTFYLKTVNINIKRPAELLFLFASFSIFLCRFFPSIIYHF
jgi:hypothetical protein